MNLSRFCIGECAIILNISNIKAEKLTGLSLQNCNFKSTRRDSRQTCLQSMSTKQISVFFLNNIKILNSCMSEILIRGNLNTDVTLQGHRSGKNMELRHNPEIIRHESTINNRIRSRN